MAACAAGVIGTAPAAALEWSSAHSVATGAGYDSNLHMSATDPDSSQNASVSASADVLARRPGLKFRLQPEVRALRYADDAESNRNDAFAVFRTDLDRPRRSASFGARYARESTLNSEFDPFGLHRIDVERVQRSADASFTQRLGTRRTLGVTASSEDTVYDHISGPAYGDFRVRDLELHYGVATSERSSMSLVASKSFVDEPAADQRSTTTQLQASWSRQFSPQLQASLGFGAFAIDGRGADPEDPSASLNLGLTRQWARFRFSSSLARDLQTQTGGTFVVEDSLTLAAGRPLGPRLGIALQLRAATQTAAVAALPDQKWKYARAGATVSWQIARRVALEASLSEYAERTALAQRASATESFVSLIYRGG
jgi:hypothetical protein